MNDPFSTNSNAQLIREAQRGLAIVVVLLALLGYIIFFKFIGSLAEIPDHVRNAPIAQTIWPYDQRPGEGETASRAEHLNASKEPRGTPVTRSTSPTAPYPHDLSDFQPSRKQTPPPSELIQRGIGEPALARVTDPFSQSATTTRQFQLPVQPPDAEPERFLPVSNQDFLPSTANSAIPTISPANHTEQSQPEELAGTDKRGIKALENRDVELTTHQEDVNRIASQQVPQQPLIQEFNPTEEIEELEDKDHPQLTKDSRDRDSAQAIHFDPLVFPVSAEAGEGNQLISAAASSLIPFETIAADQQQSNDDPLAKSRPAIPPPTVPRTPTGIQALDTTHQSQQAEPSVGIKGTEVASVKPQPPRHQKHRVKANESFWTISQQHYETGEHFRELYLFNRARVEEYDGLRPGMEIEIPSLAELKGWPGDDPERHKAGVLIPSTELSPYDEYVTLTGDTLFSIAAERLGQASRYVDIWELNRSQLPAETEHVSPLPTNLRLLLPRK